MKGKKTSVDLAERLRAATPKEKPQLEMERGMDRGRDEWTDGGIGRPPTSRPCLLQRGRSASGSAGSLAGLEVQQQEPSAVSSASCQGSCCQVS